MKTGPKGLFIWTMFDTADNDHSTNLESSTC